MSNKQAALSLLLFIGIVVYAPFMSLWTLETVFQCKIIYNFWTWLGMTWLHIIIFFARPAPSSTIINTAAIPNMSKTHSDNSKEF